MHNILEGFTSHSRLGGFYEKQMPSVDGVVASVSNTVAIRISAPDPIILSIVSKPIEPSTSPAAFAAQDDACVAKSLVEPVEISEQAAFYSETLTIKMHLKIQLVLGAQQFLDDRIQALGSRLGLGRLNSLWREFRLKLPLKLPGASLSLMDSGGHGGGYVGGAGVIPLAPQWHSLDKVVLAEWERSET